MWVHYASARQNRNAFIIIVKTLHIILFITEAIDITGMMGSSCVYSIVRKWSTAQYLYNAGRAVYSSARKLFQRKVLTCVARLVCDGDLTTNRCSISEM